VVVRSIGINRSQLFPLPLRVGFSHEVSCKSALGFAPVPPPNLIPTFTDDYILTSDRD
jgi:hypothetical protein